MDRLPRLQKGRGDGRQIGVRCQQLPGAGPEHTVFRPTYEQAHAFEQTSDLVLQVALNLYQQCTTIEQPTNRMAVRRLDLNLPVPTGLHDACDAGRVITVALVDLHGQSRLRMPCVDADDR